MRTVVHCQKPGDSFPLVRKVVRSVDEVVAFAREFNGKGSCWISKNPWSGKKGEEIDALTAFVIDVDPEREKGTAASPSQRAQALGVGRRILAVAPGGVIVDSGNGVQIIYSWPPVKKDGAFYEDFARNAASWTAGLRALAVGSGCVIDSIHDNERLIKLVSCLSVKGTAEQWRTAAFVPPVFGDARGRNIFDRIAAVRAVAPPTAGPAFERPFEDEVVVAAGALSRLGAHRGSTYHEWLKVGMALRGLGDAGLSLWDHWSERRPGYEEGACAAKWKTFEPAAAGEGVTIGTLVKWAQDDSGPDNAVAGGNQSADERAVGHPALDVGAYLDALPAREEGAKAAIELPTGIAELDAFGPLLLRGHIFTVGAYTNVGKTTLASAVAAHLAKIGKRVLFFSTENTAEEVMDRMVLSLSGGWKGSRLDAAKRVLNGLDIHVSDGFTPDAASMEKVVEKVKPDLLVFDYLQHAGTSSDNRVQELDRFVKQLHDLARRQKVAVLATAQLSRASTMEDLALRHLRECGTIENESRAVLLMKRLNPNPAAEIYPVAAVLAKNKGRHGTVQLVVNAPLGRIESISGGST